MWKKINESKDGLTEDEIINKFGSVYKELVEIQNMLNRSTNVELREKYLKPLCQFMNWLDYEI